MRVDNNIVDEHRITQLQQAIENTVNFKQFENRGSLEFKCKCGNAVTVNGATSHATICNLVHESKREFLKSFFRIKDVCVFCSNKIEYESEIRKLRKGKIDFCSSKCFTAAKVLVKKYELYESRTKICVICNKQFISNNCTTCSDECAAKLMSKKAKDWWSDEDNNDQIIARNEKIGKIASASNTGRHPWNHELHGREYLEHYEDENGRNSLHEALKKTFFKVKTKPEIAFEEILKQLSARYKYSFFCKQHQFDFLVSLSKNVFLVEIDGDYWHKSIRRASDEKDRQVKRQQDNEKASVVLNSIKHTNKKWDLIRFWEIDVRRHNDVVKQFMQKLIGSENDQSELDNVVQEIKAYYAKSC